MRATFLMAVAFIVCGSALRAGGTLVLPSNDPQVVLPLLREFSTKDTSIKSVSEDLSDILGSDYTCSCHGPGGAIYELFYGLNDDKTNIHVLFVRGKLKEITREISARVVEVLYSTPRH